MKFTDAQLLALIHQYAWTFTRISGVLMTAPILGSPRAPRRIRLMLALLLTIIMAPLTPLTTTSALFSAGWWLLTVEQLAFGIAIGFVLNIAFEAVVMGGELISYGMGLSFAQLADPARGVSTPVIGQFLMILVTLLFLSMNGHLMLIEVLAQSFHNIPVGQGGLSAAHLGEVIQWSGSIFSGGVRLALPVMVALLLVNLAFGVASRATPSLNLQSVGLPISLIAGLLLLVYSLPSLQGVFESFLNDAWRVIAVLIEAH